MSIYEEKGRLIYKDKNGDLQLLYPTTKRECLEGMEEIDNHLVDKKNPHKVSPDQIGAIPNKDIASVDEVTAFLGI